MPYTEKSIVQRLKHRVYNTETAINTISKIHDPRYDKKDILEYIDKREKDYKTKNKNKG